MLFLSKKKGSLTLEAALVMPLVIYMVFIMISLTFLLYSRAYVQLSINKEIAIATSEWYNVDSDYGGNANSYGIVANAIGTSVSSDAKKQVLENKIKERINKGVLVNITPNININRSNYLVGEKLEIKVVCEYRIPMGKLLNLLGVNGNNEIVRDSFEKTVMLSSPEASMRTISYTSDLIKRLEGSELIRKIKEALKR